MKCVIIDDEPLAIEGIQLLIQDVEDLECMATFNNPVEAISFLNQNKPDIIFLDIDMPKMTGIEFLKNFKFPAKVILTTANPNFAIEGFELDVTDYLMKPIRFARFLKAVDKAQQAITADTQLHNGSTDSIDYIFVKTGHKLVKVIIDDILYIEGLKDYVLMYNKSEKLTVATNLKAIHTQLPQSAFFRIGKSHIVNIKNISSIHHDIITINKTDLTLSPLHKDEFLKTVAKIGIIKR